MENTSLATSTPGKKVKSH